MKLTQKQTDKILQKLEDYGLKVIDTERGHGEQMDIFNIQTVSEEYFGEKINEALEGENE